MPDITSVLILTLMGVCGLWFLHKLPAGALALFLFAGKFKAASWARLPEGFDLTVLFGLIVMAVIVWQVSGRGFRLPRLPSALIIPYLLLIAMMIFSIVYTSAPNYALSKVVQFVVLGSLATLGPLFLFRTVRDVYVFLGVSVVLATAMAMESLVGSSEGQRTAFGSNYLALGGVFGMGVIILLYALIQPNIRGVWKLLMIAGLIMLLSGMMLAAGRGPFTATLAAILTVSAVTLLKRRPRSPYFTDHTIKISLVLITVIFVAIATNPLGLTTTLTKRFSELSLGNDFREAGYRPAQPRYLATDREYDVQYYGSRGAFFGFALNAMAEQPLLGLGAGGYSVYVTGEDRRFYPHNIFLELGSELGFVGPVILVLLIGLSVATLLNTRRSGIVALDSLNPILVGLLFFWLFNALVSGDINDNRFLFAVVGTIYATGALSRRIASESAPSLHHSELK